MVVAAGAPATRCLSAPDIRDVWTLTRISIQKSKFLNFKNISEEKISDIRQQIVAYNKSALNQEWLKTFLNK